MNDKQHGGLAGAEETLMGREERNGYELECSVW